MSNRIRRDAVSLTLALLAAWWPLVAVTGGGETELAEQRLLEGLTYLAADELRGRRVGTPEIDQAAEYIRQQFESAGLRTSVYDDGPFQSVKLKGYVRLGEPQQNTLRFESTDGRGPVVDARLDVDFRPLAIGGSHRVELAIVFAGYGITAPEYEYDDYQGLDVKGKAVVIVRKEPQPNDRDSLFKGRAHTKHAYFHAKIENAVSNGAAAVILVNDRHEVKKETRSLRRQWRRTMRELAAEQSKLDQSEWSESQFERHRSRVRQCIQTLTELEARWSQTDRILEVDGAGGAAVAGEIPVLFCRRQLVDQILQASCQTSLDELESQLDELKPCGRLLSGWKVQASTKLEDLQGRNVIGVLDGAGELADETVIIGAHYDHVGMGGAGSLAPWTRAVHNGADDNASGVVALIEIARRMVSAAPTPRRRVVFIAFTAEEIGLLGSEHYVREPRFPLSKTVAMLNLDMVGRLGDRPLIIQGVDTADEFSAWVESAAKQHGLSIRPRRGGNGPSDHAAFYQADIPVMHFFTGTHRDYHRPSDDIEKIDLHGLRRVTDCVTELAVRIAAAPQRPTLQRPTLKRNE